MWDLTGRGLKLVSPALAGGFLTIVPPGKPLFSFCLSARLFILSFWMIALLGRVFLVVGFFPFITLNVSWYSLLLCRVSTEKSASSLTEVPFYVTSCFSLAAFNTLSLILAILITMSFWCGRFWVDPVWNCLCFLDLYICFLSQVREVFSHYVFKYVLCLPFSFWNPYNANVSMLNVVSKVPWTVLIF